MFIFELELKYITIRDKSPNSFDVWWRDRDLNPSMMLQELDLYRGI